LEQGKDVFVVPGRIGDELSVGCNRLIRQGAVPVLSPQDILDYYGIAPPEESSIEEKKSELQQKILHTIKKTPVHIWELEAVTGESATVVMKELMWLKQKKYIREVSRGYFVEN
jgi:DNA processing protein